MGINDTYFNPFNPGMDYIPESARKVEETFNQFNPCMGKPVQIQTPTAIVSGGGAPEVGDVLHLSTRIENTLNQKYPQGWKIVGIGRSPSIIIEAMKQKGINAKSCPISGLAIGEWDFAKRFPWLKQLDPNDVRVYGEYLLEIGLAPEEIINDSKPTVFVDYTKTGNSLRGFQDLIARSEIGIKQNVKFHSINMDLIPNPTLAERGMIDRLWERQGMKIYSFMPKMDVADMGKVKSIVANFKPAECAQKFLEKLIKVIQVIK